MTKPKKKAYQDVAPNLKQALGFVKKTLEENGTRILAIYGMNPGDLAYLKGQMGYGSSQPFWSYNLIDRTGDPVLTQVDYCGGMVKALKRQLSERAKKQPFFPQLQIVNVNNMFSLLALFTAAHENNLLDGPKAAVKFAYLDPSSRHLTMCENGDIEPVLDSQVEIMKQSIDLLQTITTKREKKGKRHA